eukprot:1669834-Heterocapsa_arctica.AAC.1
MELFGGSPVHVLFGRGLSCLKDGLFLAVCCVVRCALRRCVQRVCCVVARRVFRRRALRVASLRVAFCVVSRSSERPVFLVQLRMPARPEGKPRTDPRPRF